MFLLLYFAFAYYCSMCARMSCYCIWWFLQNTDNTSCHKPHKKYSIPFGVIHMLTNVKLVMYMRPSDRQWLNHVFGNKPFYHLMLIDHKAKVSYIVNRQSHENQYYVSFTKQSFEVISLAQGHEKPCEIHVMEQRFSYMAPGVAVLQAN